MSRNPFGWDDYDRETYNEGDGQHFYGVDNDDGTTDWYTEDGTLDCRTATPDE